MLLKAWEHFREHIGRNNNLTSQNWCLHCFEKWHSEVRRTSSPYTGYATASCLFVDKPCHETRWSA